MKYILLLFVVVSCSTPLTPFNYSPPKHDSVHVKSISSAYNTLTLRAEKKKRKATTEEKVAAVGALVLVSIAFYFYSPKFNP